MTTICSNIIVSFIVKAVQKNLFVFIFLVLDRHLVFLGFWFAGLNMKFSCPKNPYFTVPRVSNKGVK